MASCKDCIHNHICLSADDFEYETVELLMYDCHKFINKANVVEVVRCKDCKYHGTSCLLMDLGLPNDFCSNGERSETE